MTRFGNSVQSQRIEVRAQESEVAGGMLCHDGTEQPPTADRQSTVTRPSAAWTRGVVSMSEKLHHQVMATTYPVYGSGRGDSTATRLDVAGLV